MATKFLKGAAIKRVECWSTKNYKYSFASGWFCYLILDLSTLGLDHCAVVLFYKLAKD